MTVTREEVRVEWRRTEKGLIDNLIQKEHWRRRLTVRSHLINFELYASDESTSETRCPPLTHLPGARRAINHGLIPECH